MGDGWQNVQQRFTSVGRMGRPRGLNAVGGTRSQWQISFLAAEFTPPRRKEVTEFAALAAQSCISGPLKVRRRIEMGNLG